jgi:hypothetical protein
MYSDAQYHIDISSAKGMASINFRDSGDRSVPVGFVSMPDQMELKPIKFLLGHVSVQTTERYLSCKQRLRGAVNDRIGIEPEK